MMNKDEAVQKLATAGRLSMAHAEDLYDSFFPKPVVPQYVADWYEEHKYNLNSEIYYLIRYWGDEERNSDFYKWFDDTKNEAIKTLVNMHQFGYEVEEELKYRVSVKAINDEDKFLKREKDENVWYFGDSSAIGILQHTRKELEDAGFEWVFDCPGVEVKEVTDE